MTNSESSFRDRVRDHLVERRDVYEALATPDGPPCAHAAWNGYGECHDCGQQVKGGYPTRSESEFADVNGTGDTVQSREQTNSLHLSREPRLAYAQGFKDGGDELRARVAELEAEMDRMKRLYQRMERSRWEAREHVAILSGEGPSAFADAKKKEADRG